MKEQAYLTSRNASIRICSYVHNLGKDSSNELVRESHVPSDQAMKDLRAILDGGSDLPFPDGLILIINGRGSNAYTFTVDQDIVSDDRSIRVSDPLSDSGFFCASKEVGSRSYITSSQFIPKDWKIAARVGQEIWPHNHIICKIYRWFMGSLDKSAKLWETRKLTLTKTCDRTFKTSNWSGYITTSAVTTAGEFEAKLEQN